MSDSHKEFPVHPLLAKLNPRPDDERRFVTIYGYIGPATRDGIICLYPSLDLRSHLEIPVAEILFAEPAEPGLYSSPTKLIVDAEADMVHVQHSRSRIAVGFVTGPIADANLKQAAPSHNTSPAESLEFTLTARGCESIMIKPKPQPVSRCVVNGACVSAPAFH